MSSSYSTVFCRIERLYVISGFGVYDTGLGFFFLGSTYHSCTRSPLGPHPTRVQSCVCCIFWTNRNSLAVTSFYLSHYPIRDMNPWISAISKWKYLLLLKLQCFSITYLNNPRKNNKLSKHYLEMNLRLWKNLPGFLPVIKQKNFQTENCR